MNLNSVFLHNIRPKQYKGASAEGSASGREFESTAGRQQASQKVIDNFFYAWPFFFEVDYYICGLSIYGFPQTLFQFLITTLFLLSPRNTAICRGNIGSWLQNSDMNCVLPTLLGVRGTVFLTTSTTSK